MICGISVTSPSNIVQSKVKIVLKIGSLLNKARNLLVLFFVPYLVIYKYNVSVNNTTLYFIYNKSSILSGRHVSTFIGSSSGPLGKQIQELSIFQCIEGYKMHLGSLNALKYRWLLGLFSQRA